MKITLGGRAGSGKSAVGKKLSEMFHLKHYSTGDLFRILGMEKGYTVEEFSKIRAEEIDTLVDNWAEKIGKSEDNFVMDSRLAFHFIPDAIKIFLDVSYEEGARRIFLKPRASEKKVESAEGLAKINRERWETDRKRYLEMYGIDVDDLRNYDVYIDSTGKKIDEVITELCRAVPALRKA
ncbi:(d)CMP kinase [Candidatus Woesearchaeota archaeon]|nr:(d)CMP kinase [Candidatus Woesearchaeota archaeon]